MSDERRKRGRPRKNPIAEPTPIKKKRGRPPKEQVKVPVQVTVVRETPLVIDIPPIVTVTTMHKYLVTMYSTQPENREVTPPDIREEVEAPSGSVALSQVMQHHNLPKYYYLRCEDITPVVPRKRRVTE